MGAVARFCDRAVLLERGRVELIGAPDEVGARYLQRNFDRDGAVVQSSEEGRVSDGTGEILDAWFEIDGSRTDVLPQGAECTAAVRIRAHAPLREPAIAVLLEDDRHHPLWAISNEDGDVPSGDHAAGDEAVFSVTFRNVFAPGRLFLTPWMVHAGGAPIIDRRPRLAAAVVTAVHRSGGLVDLPCVVRYERGVRAPA
jgi:hypothetical protein